jgi:AcrR family transcriptional regulator
MSSGDPQTRERILQETLRLMEEQRGQGVRVGDIARAAGVSRQAVYLHFGSRSNLLVSTAHYLDHIKGLEKRLEKVRSTTDGIEGLEAFIEFWGNYIPEVYGLARALRDARETDEAAAAAWNDRMNDVREGCRITVEKIQRAGLLAAEWNTETATDVMWTLLSIASWENLIDECGWTQGQYIERMQIALKHTLVR